LPSWRDITLECKLSISSLTCSTCCDTSNFAFFFELPALFGSDVWGVGDIWYSDDELVLRVVDKGMDVLHDITDAILHCPPRLDGFCMPNAE
jgi:hypothetical protein